MTRKPWADAVVVAATQKPLTCGATCAGTGVEQVIQLAFVSALVSDERQTTWHPGQRQQRERQRMTAAAWAPGTGPLSSQAGIKAEFRGGVQAHSRAQHRTGHSGTEKVS